MSIQKVLLKEWSQQQEERIRQEGQEIVDSAEVGEYELILMNVINPKHPMAEILGTGYDIGFQRKGRDFTNFDQLLGKEVVSRDGINIRVFREINKIIKQWTEKYGEITIASSDRRKNAIYQRIFKNLDYKTRIVYHMGHGFLIIS